MAAATLLGRECIFQCIMCAGECIGAPSLNTALHTLPLTPISTCCSYVWKDDIVTYSREYGMQLSLFFFARHKRMCCGFIGCVPKFLARPVSAASLWRDGRRSANPERCRCRRKSCASAEPGIDSMPSCRHLVGVRIEFAYDGSNSIRSEAAAHIRSLICAS